jgi:hypothetical protein
MQAVWLIHFGPELKLDNTLKGCDALLADWLAVRQERAREVKQAVVAAVTAAAAACHLYN